IRIMKATAVIGRWGTLILSIMLSLEVFAQHVNYEESADRDYVLPDILTKVNGSLGTDKEDWESNRRPEILDMLSKEIYGITPTDSIAVRYEVLSEDNKALKGKATSRQVKFVFTNGIEEREALLLLYIPNIRNKKLPVFIGYNFKGNHSTTLDTSIFYSKSLALVRSSDHPDWQRGIQANRWPYQNIIDRGYAVATMCYHDIFPDKEGLKDHSVAALFSSYNATVEKQPDEWQAIGVWAWGLSRILDYLLKEPW